jgi:hypothetical protein
MKKMKWLSALLTVVLVLSMSQAVFAAKPSETTTVKFTYSGIYGIDGSFTFSNPELFTNVVYSFEGMAGSVANDKVFLYDADPKTVTISLTVTISGSAKDGDSCAITFNYETSDIDGKMTPGVETKTVTVTVPTTPAGNGGSGNESGSGGGSGSGNGGNNSSTGGHTTTTTPAAKADTTELERQIKIAEGLNQAEYTGDSWKALADALSTARGLLNSTSQSDVDAAAAALASAIDGLVKMDYTKLQEAIDAAKAITDTDELGQQFASFFDALSESIDALTSTDQAVVDAAAEKLAGLVQQIEEALAALREGNVVTVEVPVEVEVEPTTPYCNIAMHKVWPVLFFISLFINIALIALIVIYLVRRKRDQEDSNPMLDYDIDDDAEADANTDSEQ